MRRAHIVVSEWACSQYGYSYRRLIPTVFEAILNSFIQLLEANFLSPWESENDPSHVPGQRAKLRKTDHKDVGTSIKKNVFKQLTSCSNNQVRRVCYRRGILLNRVNKYFTNFKSRI